MYGRQDHNSEDAAGSSNGNRLTNSVSPAESNDPLNHADLLSLNIQDLAKYESNLSKQLESLSKNCADITAQNLKVEEMVCKAQQIGRISAERVAELKRVSDSIAKKIKYLSERMATKKMVTEFASSLCSKRMKLMTEVTEKMDRVELAQMEHQSSIDNFCAILNSQWNEKDGTVSQKLEVLNSKKMNLQSKLTATENSFEDIIKSISDENLQTDNIMQENANFDQVMKLLDDKSKLIKERITELENVKLLEQSVLESKKQMLSDTVARLSQIVGKSETEGKNSEQEKTRLLDRLTQQNAAAEKMSNILKNMIERENSARSEADRLIHLRDKLKETIEIGDIDFNSKKEKLRIIEQKLEPVQAELSETHTLCARKEELVKKMKVKICENGIEYEHQREDIKIEIEALQNARESLRALKETVEDVKSTLADLRLRQETVSQKISSLTVEKDTLDAKNHELQRSVDDIVVKLEEISDGMSSKNHELDALQRDLGCLKLRLISTKENVDVNNKTIKASTLMLSDMKNEIEKIRCDQMEARKQTEETVTRIKQRQVDLETEREQLHQNAKSKKQQLNEELENLLAQNQKLEKSLAAKFEVENFESTSAANELKVVPAVTELDAEKANEKSQSHEMPATETALITEAVPQPEAEVEFSSADPPLFTSLSLVSQPDPKQHLTSTPNAIVSSNAASADLHIVDSLIDESLSQIGSQASSTSTESQGSIAISLTKFLKERNPTRFQAKKSATKTAKSATTQRSGRSTGRNVQEPSTKEKTNNSKLVSGPNRRSPRSPANALDAPARSLLQKHVNKNKASTTPRQYITFDDSQ